MTYAEVATMISAMGVPYAYYQFDAKTAQAPPFICFFYSEDADLIADNINYQKLERLVIELYTDAKDFAMEAAVEGILRNYEIPYAKAETYIDSERLYEVIYETTIVITQPVNSSDVVGEAQAGYAEIRG